MSHSHPHDIYILGVQNERVINSSWEEYGGLSFNDVRAMWAYALEATDNFGALVVDNTAAGEKGAPVKTVRAQGKLLVFKIKQG